MQLAGFRRFKSRDGALQSGGLVSEVAMRLSVQKERRVCAKARCLVDVVLFMTDRKQIFYASLNEIAKTSP